MDIMLRSLPSACGFKYVGSDVELVDHKTWDRRLIAVVHGFLVLGPCRVPAVAGKHLHILIRIPSLWEARKAEGYYRSSLRSRVRKHLCLEDIDVEGRWS